MTIRSTARLGEWGWLDAWFLDLIDAGRSGLAFTAAALVLAFVVGVVHALGPGHGKVLIAAYMAGSDGRARDAVAFGGIVASMHTGSVLVIGYVLHLTQRMPVGDHLGSVLTLVSATSVAAVGAWMLWRQPAVRSRLPRSRSLTHTPAPIGAHAASSTHGQRAHGHALPEGVAPLSGPGIVALATTGGLLPSPGAFLVLTTALAMGRPEFGLALVAAFSLGLASTLTAVGIGVLSGRDAVVRGAGRSGRWLRVSHALPLVAAGGVFLGGVAMAVATIVAF